MKEIPPIDEKLVERGIYIDFEKTLRAEIPQILGVMIEGQYICYVIDSCLELAAINRIKQKTSENWMYEDPKNLLNKLLRFAEEEQRKIIGYSQSDMKTMIKIIGVKERIENSYFNANMATWFRKRRKTSYKNLLYQIKNDKTNPSNRVGLKDLLSLDYVKYKYPSSINDYSPAKALREMMKCLNERKDYHLVPKGIKKSFGKMYQYNFHDCNGMKHLLEYRLRFGDLNKKDKNKIKSIEKQLNE